MLPKYPHAAIIITGAMQMVVGAGILIPCCMGLDNYFQVYRLLKHTENRAPPNLFWLAYVFVSSSAIMMNGSSGIMIGVKLDNHRFINRYRIRYIVSSLVTAAVFCWPGAYTQIAHIYLYMSQSQGKIVLIGSIAGGILCIVSASISCIYATSLISVGNAPTTPGENTTVSYSANNYPPISHLPGNLPPGAYPPGNYPPGAYPPGNYPTGQNLPGAYQPGDHLPGNYPPGNYPAGQNPPGNYPPGNYPTGQNPPGKYPPGNDSNQAPQALQAPEAGSIDPA